MSYRFLKGHGTENDFVLLPDPDGSVHGELSVDRVRALCDRRAGIGGDGVLRAVRQDGRWFMDYRNADGSVSEMCGNGIRVFARYLLEHEGESSPLEVDTRDGVKTITRDGDAFTVDMGSPEVFDQTFVSVDGVSHPALHVSTGNPHAVAFVDSLDAAGTLLEEPGYDRAVYPDGRQRRVRRTPRGTPRRHARPRAGVRRDAILRHRRLRRHGRRGTGRRRTSRDDLSRRRARRQSRDHLDRGRPDADDRSRGPRRRGHHRPLSGDSTLGSIRLMDITGATAIVTGGASGIGAAVARALAARGAVVVVADINAEQGEALADEIKGVFARVDVTETEQIAAAVEAAAEIAPLRACVNSAGIGWAQRTIGRDGRARLGARPRRVPPRRRDQPHRHL